MSNITILTGNLAADPELRFTPKGTAVANARLIHSESYFNKETNEWQEGTPVAIDLEIWGASAEALPKYAGKGTELLIEAALVSNDYTNKETGKTVYGHRLKVKSWKVISRGLSNEKTTPEPETKAPTKAKKTPAAKKAASKKS